MLKLNTRRDDMNLDILAKETLEGRRSYKKFVEHTLSDARKQHGDMKSFHEGLAVILEEFEEFKQEVFRKVIDKEAILMELASVSAMCQRFAEDLLRTKDPEALHK
jgi:uncharacterized Zn finger protein